MSKVATENFEWLATTVQQLAETSPDYVQQATFLALNKHLQAQQQRLEIAAAELDGRQWDHEAW